MAGPEFKYDMNHPRVGEVISATVQPQPKVGDRMGFGVAGEVLAEYDGTNWRIVGVNEDPYNQKQIK